MARRVFYSFHYQLDNWRVQQVMNMGAVEGQPLLRAHEWDEVAKGGDDTITGWIDDKMVGTSCNVVLIGSKTAGRTWVDYEIRKAWKSGKGVVGVYIHKLKDKDGNTSSKGANPFALINLKGGGTLASSVKAINPPGSTSTEVYYAIKDNLEQWVEDAIAARTK